MISTVNAHDGLNKATDFADENAKFSASSQPFFKSFLQSFFVALSFPFNITVLLC